MNSLPQLHRVLVAALMLGPLYTTAAGQERGQSNKVGSAPANGQPLPDVTVSLSDGTPLSTSQMKGSYTVLVFGCLT